MRTNQTNKAQEMFDGINWRAPRLLIEWPKLEAECTPGQWPLMNEVRKKRRSSTDSMNGGQLAQEIINQITTDLQQFERQI